MKLIFLSIQVYPIQSPEKKCKFSIAPTWVHTDVRYGALIRKGSVSVYTFVLQDALDYLGHPLAIDGVFGPGTERALKTWQTKNKLISDGVCGPSTWTAICSAVARKRGN